MWRNHSCLCGLRLKKFGYDLSEVSKYVPMLWKSILPVLYRSLRCGFTEGILWGTRQKLQVRRYILLRLWGNINSSANYTRNIVYKATELLCVKTVTVNILSARLTYRTLRSNEHICQMWRVSAKRSKISPANSLNMLSMKLVFSVILWTKMRGPRLTVSWNSSELCNSALTSRETAWVKGDSSCQTA